MKLKITYFFIVAVIIALIYIILILLTPGPSPNRLGLPTFDSGKVCSDSDQCQGLCIAKLTLSEEGQIQENYTEIRKNGTCSAWTTVIGCIYIVEDGTVGSALCFD